MNTLPDKEQRLLMLLIAGDADSSPFREEFADGAGALDWPHFAELVQRHRVAALVHAGLLRSPHIEIPRDLNESFERSNSRNAAVYLRTAAFAGKLGAELQHEGIACVVLKGSGIAAKHYTVPSEREMIDLDLLVARDRFEDAEAIVLSHGFSRIYPKFELTKSTRASFYRLHNAFTYFRTSDGLQLDLHWRTVKNPVVLPEIDQNWSQMTVVDKATGVAIPMLHTPVHFIYVLVHGAKSGWVRLKWLADVDRMARTLSPTEQDEIAKLAERFGLGRLISASLGLAQGLLGTRLPAPLSDLTREHDGAKLIALQLPMIFSELPDQRHKLSDWRYFIGRIRHSLALQDGKSYRRETLLRELSRPADLENVRIGPAAIWALPALSPLFGIGRAVSAMFSRSD